VKKEIHVYAGTEEKMPPRSIAEFWQVQKAIAMGQGYIATNQVYFVSAATARAGYSITVHDDGKVYRVAANTADEVGRKLRAKAKIC